ncbi:MAG TPA: hypothetical protein VIM11_08515 [Tepidisphaeraceae bacterium]|jgi:hypothetical protein
MNTEIGQFVGDLHWSSCWRPHLRVWLASHFMGVKLRERRASTRRAAREMRPCADHIAAKREDYIHGQTDD